MIQFITGIISGVASGLWADRLKAWVVGKHGGSGPPQASERELLERIAHNTRRDDEVRTEEYRREIVKIFTLFQPPFMIFINRFNRNHVWIVSNAAFTLQYEDGSTIAIPAGVMTEVRNDQRVSLTPGDAATSRLVTVYARD